MQILFKGLGKVRDVALTREGIKFTTIVETDFGSSSITIELAKFAILG